jgi:hypothetical protein
LNSFQPALNSLAYGENFSQPRGTELGVWGRFGDGARTKEIQISPFDPNLWMVLRNEGKLAIGRVRPSGGHEENL